MSRCDFYDNNFTNVAVTGAGEEIGGSSSRDKFVVVEESHSGLPMPLESDTIAAKSLQQPQTSKVADDKVSKIPFLIMPIKLLFADVFY